MSTLFVLSSIILVVLGGLVLLLGLGRLFSQKTRKTGLKMIGAAVVFAALGGLCFPLTRWAARREINSPQGIGGVSVLIRPTEGITLAKYHRVMTGMTYGQATAILGPGTEASRSELAGITTVMYTWSNPTGSNMNAIFQDGKLVQKAQFDLR